jgi:hypothetical protein
MDKKKPATPDVKNSKQDNKTDLAHTEADKDIEQDLDLTIEPRKEDDLDEGELARLEGEE